MIKNEVYVEKCRRLIECSLNWGDSSTWANEDFENLSEKIFDKTDVQLSVSTLKRIWGKVKYDSSPNSATLNALARFIDYESWREFQQKNAVVDASVAEETIIQPQPVVTEIAPTPQANSHVATLQPIKRNRRVLMPLLSIGILCLACFITFFLMGGKKSSAGPVMFTARLETKQTSDDLPNSVVFNYDASQFHSDSVYLQQSWDVRRRERLDPNGNQHTSIYYYPGYFRAKLLVDGKIVKQSDVFIKTKGWAAYIQQNPVPIYLSKNDFISKGAMGISSTLLKEKTGSSVFNNTWTGFSNVKELAGVDSTNFTFETTLRNTSTVEESSCRKAGITVIGSKAPVIVPLSTKGCISDLNILNGMSVISGKQTDLSAFGCDMANFQHLKFSVQNKHLLIWLNEKLIMNTPQPHDIGRVVGVGIDFEGTGQIKNVKLYSPGKAPAIDEVF